MRVLIVDDNKDIAESMAMLIEVNGHRTFVAYEAETGFKLAIEHLPHIIFHDIALPGMSGWDAALRLRKVERLKNTILVAHTAYAMDADRARAMASGFHYFLGKPSDPATLENLLRTIAARP